MSIEKFRKFLFPILFIFPLLNHPITSYLYCLIGLISLFYFIKNKIKIKHFDWFFLTPFFLIIIGGWNSSNIKEYLNLLSINLMSILIILIFILTTKNDFKLKLGLNIFAISSILCCLIFSTYAISLHGIQELFQSNLNGTNYRQIIEKIPFFEVNIIYYSLFIVISIIIVMDDIDFKQIGYKLVLKILGVLLLLFNLILFSSKMAIISLSIYAIISLYKKRKYLKYYWFLILTFIILLFFLLLYCQNSFFIKRFIEPFYFFKLPHGMDYSSTSIRLGIYFCLDEIIRQNFLFGVGTGDVFDSLSYCFQQFNTNAYNSAKFGSHNNFLWYFISNGIFGFLVFLSFTIYVITKVRKYNKDYTIFILIMFINMISEDILIRQRGVILFYLLISPFVIKSRCNFTNHKS